MLILSMIHIEIANLSSPHIPQEKGLTRQWHPWRRTNLRLQEEERTGASQTSDPLQECLDPLHLGKQFCTGVDDMQPELPYCKPCHYGH